MIGLIQRVSLARVEIGEETVGTIGKGILLFLGVEKNDTRQQADKLLHKVLNYRIFEDDSGRMNLSLKAVVGELMIISQFTLPADTRKGMRPSFTPAAPPAEGKALYDYFVEKAASQINKVASGQFGADMKVSLTNDGPVTFWLRV